MDIVDSAFILVADVKNPINICMAVLIVDYIVQPVHKA